MSTELHDFCSPSCTVKRVLLVSPLPPPYGGIPHWTAMMLRHSRTVGKIPLQVIDIAARHRDRFEMSFASRVLRGLPALIRQMMRVIRALPSKDVLALHVTTPGHYALARDIWMLLLARIFRRRGILHIRIGRVPAVLASAGLESFILRLGLKIASHVIAIDEATELAIRKSLPSVAISRVPNCIDMSVLPEVPARKTQTILFVGWVMPAKGIEELLTAWSGLARSDWCLKIIGPYSAEYVTDLGSRYSLERVELTGELRNSSVLAEIAQAAVLCLPSYTEGFPNVVLEAMALRCAVVATPVGAIPEMLADGAGALVDVRDAAGLGNQLLALVDDPVARNEMATRAYAKATRQYAIDNVYETYEAIWKGNGELVS